MNALSLALLRLTLGILLFWWGTDKIMNVEHAQAVSDSFYLGLLSHPGLLPVLGAVQMVLALVFLLGYKRRWVDPVVVLIYLATAVGVWRSLLDPFGYLLEGTNALFFPSAVVFAGSLVLMTSHARETLVLDRALAKAPEPPPPVVSEPDQPVTPDPFLDDELPDI
ncbi:MAG: DoxX family membrane protein [Gemmatimonadota bacterium]